MNNNSAEIIQSQSPRLCGGTLFTLLLKLAIRSKPDSGKRFSARDVFKGLTEAVTGVELATSQSTLGIYTSYYSSCKDKSYTTPLNDASVAAQYNYDVMNNYGCAEDRMAHFIKKYIDSNKKEILVRSIVDLINNDTSILPSEHFYIINAEDYTTKYQLEIEHTFVLSSFLVGVMHFVLTTRVCDNSLGAATISLWESNKPYPFGSSINHPIIVEYPSDAPPPEKTLYTFSAPLNRTPLDIYLQKIMPDLMEVHTVINENQPSKFSDIYIETNLKMCRVNEDSDKDELLSDVTVQKLEEYGRRHKIIGLGGVGKTMLLRSIFAKQVENYRTTNIFPIFIEARSFDISYSTLIEYVVASMKHYSTGITVEMIQKLLDAGKVVLFFDGVDEMTAATRDVFMNHIDSFKSLYPNITIIITSRPPTRDVHFPGFVTFEAQKLTRDQAIELIKKITYWDKDAKNRFVKELKNGFFEAHEEYCGIPLFLVILLATYRTNGSVPSSPHEFFEKALETMLGLHDALKHGYKRRMYCSLDSHTFKDYFAEFCFRSYSRADLDFTKESFAYLMNKVIDNWGLSNGATADDFLNDATEGVCILYKEARKYHFLHRSFIEYLTAYHFSNHIVGRYESLKEFWDKHAPGWDDDHTFDMLYAMKQRDLDMLLFLPFFEEKLQKYGEGDYGYWQFLFDMYPNNIVSNANLIGVMENGSEALQSVIGSGSTDGSSTSFLYNFFKRKKGFSYSSELSSIKWSVEELLFFRGWYIEKETSSNKVPYYYHSLPVPIHIYQQEHTGLPRYVFTMHPKDIKLANDEIAIDLYEKLTDSYFPLRREYDKLCEWVRSSREELDSLSKTQDLVESLC